MGVEIERRFLVDGRYDKPWRTGNQSDMNQHYLSNVSHIDGKILWQGIQLVEEDGVLENLTTWRIRLSDDKATLTAKGRRIGATATEYNWDVPIEIYDSLPLDGLPSVKKIRHYWNGEDGLLWEVDEYEGSISGLIIAEVELESEDQEVILPNWLGLELTHLKGWSNASLSSMIKDSELS
ncbi:MAG: CYTH domain-containing protein [Candidatus Poseidoniaceae archaeon]